MYMSLLLTDCKASQADFRANKALVQRWHVFLGLFVQLYLGLAWGIMCFESGQNWLVSQLTRHWCKLEKKSGRDCRQLIRVWLVRMRHHSTFLSLLCVVLDKTSTLL